MTLLLVVDALFKPKVGLAGVSRSRNCRIRGTTFEVDQRLASLLHSGSAMDSESGVRIVGGVLLVCFTFLAAVPVAAQQYRTAPEPPVCAQARDLESRGLGNTYVGGRSRQHCQEALQRQAGPPPPAAWVPAPGPAAAPAPAVRAPAPASVPTSSAWVAELPTVDMVRKTVHGLDAADAIARQDATYQVLRDFIDALSGQKVMFSTAGVPPAAVARWREYQSAQSVPTPGAPAGTANSLSPAATRFAQDADFHTGILTHFVSRASLRAYERTPAFVDLNARSRAQKQAAEHAAFCGPNPPPVRSGAHAVPTLNGLRLGMTRDEVVAVLCARPPLRFSETRAAINRKDMRMGEA